jgi:hypothetical protein
MLSGEDGNRNRATKNQGLSNPKTFVDCVRQRRDGCQSKKNEIKYLFLILKNVRLCGEIKDVDFTTNSCITVRANDPRNNTTYPSQRVGEPLLDSLVDTIQSTNPLLARYDSIWKKRVNR